MIRFRAISLLVPLLWAAAGPAAADADVRFSEEYGRLPLHFEANRGQAHAGVRYLSRGPGYALFLTAQEAVLRLAGGREAAALRIGLSGAAPRPDVGGEMPLPGKANYFIGGDPARWRRDIPTYARVRYRDVYPGIDLVYYGNQRQLEYDFVVSPGADPGRILLDFRGADRLELAADGDLFLHLPGGTVRQKKPIVYQEADGIRREIAGRYVRQGANRIGFELGAYDASRPLVIDPLVLAYSTYLGGSGNEHGAAIAVDAGGNAYVTGSTGSDDFPTTAGALQGCAPSFCSEIFVTKLTPDGTALLYSTYLGGVARDSGLDIAVDASGNAYVTGSTYSPDFPTTEGALQRDLRGYTNAFVAKLDGTGSALIYSTLLGGERFNTGHGIEVDAAGHAFVGGTTQATDFPTTAGAFQAAKGGGSSDAFVAKLDPAGSSLVYATYLGGDGYEEGFAIALDHAGHVYVAGHTQAEDFPATPQAFQPALRSGASGNAFVAKLDQDGSALAYATYLGGSMLEQRHPLEHGYGSADYAFDIAVDATGHAFVTGMTHSSDFPTTPGAFQPRYGLGFQGDGFVTKLDPTGSALVYSTYLGGVGRDEAWGIAIDGAGFAYLTGVTHSPNFPTTLETVQAYRGDLMDADAFVTKLNRDGSGLVYSTFLGGRCNGSFLARCGSDSGRSIAVDGAGSAYLTGSTSASDFPTTEGAFRRTAQSGEAFVAKIRHVAF